MYLQFACPSFQFRGVGNVCPKKAQRRSLVGFRLFRLWCWWYVLPYQTAPQPTVPPWCSGDYLCNTARVITTNTTITTIITITIITIIIIITIFAGCANRKVMLRGLFMQNSQGHHQHHCRRDHDFSVPNTTSSCTTKTRIIWINQDVHWFFGAKGTKFEINLKLGSRGTHELQVYKSILIILLTLFW